MPASYKAILEEITAAFKDAPFPADGYDIYAAQTDDDYGDPRFTTEHLPGRKWFEVTDAQLDDCYAALSYLRPDGWRHYLPAWMVREIKKPYSGQVDVLFSLRKPEGENDHVLESKHDILNEDQVKAIVSYLEFYRQRERNIHATHEHHRYAAMNMTWTEEIFPWPRQERVDTILAYWKEKL